MGAQKNVPKNEEEKKKIVVFWEISQVNNELPCVLLKRTSIQLKRNGKKCGKQYKSIRIWWYWGKWTRFPAANILPIFLLDATLLNCPCRFIPQVGFTNVIQKLKTNDKGTLAAFVLYHTAF